MGQSAGLILGTAAAVVGGVLSGGSLLAVEAGFMIGSMLGALLFPPKKPSPADVRVQDSAYGKFIPKVWGRYRLSGNMIWAGTPHSHDQSGGGKGGGGKGGNQPYTTMSFAVALCEGTVDAILRIWANGKLIYDVSNPSDWQSISGSNTMITGWTMYPGDENQTADPTMESQLGTGNVPAYRGLCYVVFNELNLQQWGNYLPSLSFEVVRDATPATVFTGIVDTVTSVGISASTPFASQIDQAGNMWGFVKGLYTQNLSSFALRAFKLTSYGVQYTGAVFATGLDDPPADGCESYDAPGIMCGSTWYGNDGSISYCGFSPGLFLNQNGRAIRRNNMLYYTTNWGAGAYPLYITPVLGLAHAEYWTSAQSFVQEICGVTDSYVYTATHTSDPTYPSSILKWDLQGNFIGVAISGKGGIGTRMNVVSDTQIYISFFTDPSHVYRWDGGSNLTQLEVQQYNLANQNLFVIGGGENIIMASNWAEGSAFVAGVVGYTGTQISLADIVEEVCEDATLQPAQYSAGTLTDNVIGYASTNNSSARDMLTPLLSTYFVDISDSDGQLKFIKRGATPGMTIPWDDLGADTQQDSDQATNPIKETILQEFELPAFETLSYISSTTDYQTNTQQEPYPGTTSNLNESTNIPVVLADNDAKVRVQAMLWERWSKRRTFEFATGYKYLQIEPGDVVNLQRQDGSLIPVRITKLGLDGKGSIAFSADFTVPQIYPSPGQQTYTAQGANNPGFRKQTIDYSGPTLLVVIDCPPLRAQDATTPGLYLAAAGFDNTWPGCYVDMSRDDVNFTQLFTMSSPSIIGQALTQLPVFNGGDMVDELSTVQVQLYNENQALSTISYAALINGGNAAILGNEIFYFRTATQINANTWQLTGFLRARLGSSESNHNLGEIFCMLDPNALSVANINLTDIGQKLYFETYLRNILGNTPSGPVTATPSNARLAPLSPARLSAAKGAYSSTVGGNSDVVLRWFRRARINYGWYDGTDVPLDWSQESYQIIVSDSSGSQKASYVLSSAGISRNGAAAANASGQPLPPFSSPVFVYTNAMMTTDGLASGSTYTVTIRQIGDFGVSGTPSSTTFVR